MTDAERAAHFASMLNALDACDALTLRAALESIDMQLSNLAATPESAIRMATRIVQLEHDVRHLTRALALVLGRLGEMASIGSGAWRPPDSDLESAIRGERAVEVSGFQLSGAMMSWQYRDYGETP